MPDKLWFVAGVDSLNTTRSKDAVRAARRIALARKAVHFEATVWDQEQTEVHEIVLDREETGIRTGASTPFLLTSHSVKPIAMQDGVPTERPQKRSSRP